MSFSRNSHGGPPNGTSFSQSRHNSFHASQSHASTPAGSPPPRASQHSNVSTSFSTNGMNNSMSRGSYGGYNEGNGYRSMPYQDGYKPQIYTAVYSNVSVYEMEVNGVAMMRRRSDSWLNATQILKVAGVAKARRTKTLEKEVAAGEHEKVQGGYGKYQGTWVSYERGLELCRRYQVEDLLRPLLEYDMGQDGVSAAGQGQLDTPTKEQALAVQRKRFAQGLDTHTGAQSGGTFFQSISRTAATAVNAISKARFDTSSRGPDGRQPSMTRKSSQMSSQDAQYQSASQQSIQTVVSDSGFGSNLQNSQRSFAEYTHDDNLEPPRKRMRSSSTAQQMSFANNTQPTSSMAEPTPTEPNDSFYPEESTSNRIPDDPRHGIPALPAATTPERFQKMKLIMTLFLDKRMKDFEHHPAFLTLTAEDLETPLDEFLNSALHWAAMLARLPLVNALIAKGVNIFRLNAAGETALQKAVGTRNNLDYRSFSRLLSLLGSTIEIIDLHGRTILHHISMMAATGGGGHVAAKHYLESLLEYIVRHGGTTNGASGFSESPKFEIIGLGRFMSEMVNIQDDQGDTALNLAGRARTVLVPQLLEVGADPHIPNNTGLRPADYGVGVDMVNGNSQGLQIGSGGDAHMSQLARTKKEILESTVSQISTAIEASISSFDKELASSFSEKQQEFNEWHAKIRESAKARQIEQNRLDEMKKKTRERIELQRQIKNLTVSSEALVEQLRQSKNGDRASETLAGKDRVKFDKRKIDELFPDGAGSTRMRASTVGQGRFIFSLPRLEQLKTRLKCCKEQTASILAEVEKLKTKNVVLGENYRRMVMACTGWSAEDVDNAADGLTDCIKDLNKNPVPQDQAIEILMKDRGQDW
ncbi:APSES transcription factor [Trichophyton tonsurans CBS 112818]|uniref:Cell pattern formation-associated protein stuA n=2 Tax=Trichophyton TaxID=5550 RepID=F2Q3G8_TRIEC|nr:APSES transcription factor [Trichophyton tonsurans CBS 112818]EGE08686.1 start control protein cdc10 [Trichophyton equinum CBS 127.97]